VLRALRAQTDLEDGASPDAAQKLGRCRIDTTERGRLADNECGYIQHRYRARHFGRTVIGRLRSVTPRRNCQKSKLGRGAEER